jgi:hypothetical protein
MLPTLAARAGTSPFWLWVLNRVLSRTIPFNRPHGFELLEIGENVIRTTASCKRTNQNHVRGIHACAIATVAEFSAGFLLLTKLNPKRYRLIMSRIEVEYLYQAKERIFSESFLAPEVLAESIYKPLQEKDTATITLASDIKDFSGNEIAAASTCWQVKQWDRVRTKL